MVVGTGLALALFALVALATVSVLKSPFGKLHLAPHGIEAAGKLAFTATEACGVECRELARGSAHAKTARLAAAAIASAPAAERFAALRPVVPAQSLHRAPPATERFGEVKAAFVQAPRAARFGPAPAANGVTPASLALAYAHASPDGEDGGTAGRAFSALDLDKAPGSFNTPASVPLPVRRPQVSEALARAEPAPRSPAAKPQKPVKLAYARPGNPEADDEDDGGLLGKLFSPDRGGKSSTKVAVYDISAATVYMPNGDRLEAHSGVGHMADNPRYVDRKNVGPTPPNTYRLVMRESRFHGVEAIRMLPTDNKKMFGRDGILAHTYLLRGRPAQSSGCVAFKDYSRFLAAFKKGRITHIVVVPSLGSRSYARVASAAAAGV